ncbi:MAG: hypothetical protein ACRD2G_01210 [Terriglobia bacterium]
MGKEISQLATLLRKRLHTLKSLSIEIAAGQKACIALDLGGVQAHDRGKEDLCAELGRIEAEITALQESPAHEELFQGLANRARGVPEGRTDQETLRRLWEESEAARIEAGRCNDVYAEFLRRARSTVGVMMNVMSHCLGVYPSEMFPAPAQSPFERSF